MKASLRKIFWPVLRFFETEEPAVNYKPSHRTILNVVGGLFLFLSLVSAIAVVFTGNYEALVPVIVFFAIGAVSLIVGSLGSKNAVARIWGNK